MLDRVYLASDGATCDTHQISAKYPWRRTTEHRVRPTIDRRRFNEAVDVGVKRLEAIVYASVSFCLRCWHKNGNPRPGTTNARGCLNVFRDLAREAGEDDHAKPIDVDSVGDNIGCN